MIHLTHLDLKEVCVLNYDTKEDNRGIGYRLFSKRQLEEVGIYTEFVEEILNCPSKKEHCMEFIFKIIPERKTNCYSVLKAVDLTLQ